MFHSREHTNSRERLHFTKEISFIWWNHVTLTHATEPSLQTDLKQKFTKKNKR